MLSHFIIKIRFSNIMADKSPLVYLCENNCYMCKNFNYFK